MISFPGCPGSQHNSGVAEVLQEDCVLLKAGRASGKIGAADRRAQLCRVSALEECITCCAFFKPTQ
jgi:hypothetical protein